MKFILPEYNKYFLNESVDLVEATLLENEQAIRQTLSNLFTNLESKLKNRLDTDFNLTILDGTPVEPQKAQLAKDLNTIRQEIYDLLFKKKQFKEILKPIYDKAKSKGQLKNDGYNVGNITTLSKKLSSAVDSINKQISVLNNPEKNKSNITKNPRWFDNFKQTLTEIKGTLVELYKAVGSSEDKEPEKPVEKPATNSAAQRIQIDMLFEKVFKKLPEAKAKYNGENIAIDKLLNITNVTDQIAILQYCCGEQKISSLSDNAKTMFKTITTDTTYPTLDQLWQMYYKWSWERAPENVKKLHNILYPLLFKYGFSEKVNVLVNFLRRIFNSPVDSTAINDITPQAFAGITALFEKQRITAAELGAITNASAAITADNTQAITMLLCPALYKLTDSNLVFRLVTQSKAVVKDIEIEQIQGSANEAQKKIAVLSFCFTAKPDIDVAASPLAELNKILMNDATKNDLYNSSNKECLLSQNATLLDETLMKRRIVSFTDSTEGNKKTVLNSGAGAKNMWLKITEHYKFKTDIAKLFHFILSRYATNINTYKACAKIISKKLFGTESEKLVADSSEDLLKHLNTYLKIIDGIDLADSHLLPTIKLLFEDANIPKDLA